MNHIRCTRAIAKSGNFVSATATRSKAEARIRHAVVDVIRWVLLSSACIKACGQRSVR
jgi:hypothetical protein